MVRIYNESSMPVSPRKNSIYIIENDTNLEIHFVDESGNVTAHKAAAVVAALGTTTDLTAIGGSFADLAAARTAVNTLKTEVETRLDAIEAKVDAVIAALKTAKLMKTS